ncbi:MAG: hypothetical protein ACOY94_06385 [Bacillota bacterium]
MSGMLHEIPVGWVSRFSREDVLSSASEFRSSELLKQMAKAGLYELGFRYSPDVNNITFDGDEIKFDVIAVVKDWRRADY